MTFPEAFVVHGDPPQMKVARLCQYGGAKHKPAVVFDIDGAWCSVECRDHDRASEMTVWRRWSE